MTKRKQTFNMIEHQRGKNNSQYGSCWITNGKENKKIKKEELDKYLELGYNKGRIKNWGQQWATELPCTELVYRVRFPGSPPKFKWSHNYQEVAKRGKGEAQNLYHLNQISYLADVQKLCEGEQGSRTPEELESWYESNKIGRAHV